MKSALPILQHHANMKIYRVSKRDNYSEHLGYEYYSSKRVANRLQESENRFRSESQMEDEVLEIEFDYTESEILEKLKV